VALLDASRPLAMSRLAPFSWSWCGTEWMPESYDLDGMYDQLSGGAGPETTPRLARHARGSISEFEMGIIDVRMYDAARHDRKRKAAAS